MEIHKMLALSTGHLTRETRGLLDQAANPHRQTMAYKMPVTFMKDEYGWFVHVAEDTPLCPTDLEACLHLARHKHCGWIMFDRDVDPIEVLPTFED